MIGKERKYKGLDFTDSVQCTSQQSNGYSYIFQDIVRNVPLRTEIYDRANFHGGYSSETLAGSRIFTFSGKVIGTNKDNRDTGRTLLVNQIKPEGNPNIVNRGFYDLTWKTDGGDDRTCKAKVYSMPSPTNGLDSPIIDYNFELYCEDEKIYDPTIQSITGGRGFVGGITLPIPLPTYLSGFSGYIPVTNNGNWYAPVKIQIVGQATNPQVINLTNSNKYRITGVTTNFVLDNRNLLNDPTQSLVVTDNGVNIKSQRSSGADIFLDPGVNHIVILTDVPSERPVVYITFRHTYIR